MAGKKKKGLGRGLEVLLGEVPEISLADGAPTTLPVHQLQPGKYQPRTYTDEGGLNELAESIRQQGVMQHILVRPAGRKNGTEMYEIIAGERRFRAAIIAGLESIPVSIRDVDDQTAAVMALMENIQRENLNPLEEAQGFHRLIRDFEFTPDRVAEEVGRSSSAIRNSLRLLNLTDPVKKMLIAGDIEMGHARALLAVDSATQIQLAGQVAAKRMSVRDTEKLVAATLAGNPAAKKRRTNQTPADIMQLEEELSDLLATRVSFRIGAKSRGQMLIDFANLDVLDGIIQRLRSSSQM